MKVALIQMNSRDNKSDNLRQAKELIEAAADATHPDLIILPETFTLMGGTQDLQREAAEVFPSGEAYRLVQGLASRLGITIHAGSMLEREDQSYYNTTVAFDSAGKELARYRKIHLFDVVTPGGFTYRESAFIGRGKEVVTYPLGDVKIGCSICYDIRFAELYRSLAQEGVSIITIPAAFTMETGKDHWEILCRARAIETQTYVLAPNQVGQYTEGNSVRACYGHTMVVDPWGHVIAQAQDKPGFITASLDLAYLSQIRRSLPVQQHHILP